MLNNLILEIFDLIIVGMTLSQIADSKLVAYQQLQELLEENIPVHIMDALLLDKDVQDILRKMKPPTKGTTKIFRGWCEFSKTTKNQIKYEFLCQWNWIVFQYKVQKMIPSELENDFCWGVFYVKNSAKFCSHSSNFGPITFSKFQFQSPRIPPWTKLFKFCDFCKTFRWNGP